MSNDDFTYGQPLQGRNIRLIKIRLGTEKSSKIWIVQEALSYVRGQKTTIQQIKCNGRSFCIGANLLDALVERARRRSAGFLWADAICINQNDNQEKTRQVRMMHEIYSKAQNVIIWLGKEQVRDQEGWNLVKSLYKRYDGDNYNMYATTYDFGDFDLESKGFPCPSRSPEWAAVFDILSYPWFSRIWVVQELLLAKRSTMWRGGLSLHTGKILWMALQIGRNKDLYESFNNFMDSPQVSALMARAIASGYFEYKKYGPISIYDTLSRYNGMEATDPRDRYFALSGISIGLDPRFVDYEKSFIDIACLVGKMTLLGLPKYSIGTGGNEELVLLGSCEKHWFLIEWLAFHANPQNHKLGLPSWIPDLISPHSPGLIMSGFYNTKYLQGFRKIPFPEIRLMSSTGAYWSGHSSPPQRLPLPDNIEIMGAVFDHVQALGRERPALPRADPGIALRVAQGNDTIDPFRASEAMSRYETEMIDWLSSIRTLADPSVRAPRSIMSGSPESFDAFWRALVYDREPHFNYKSPNQKPADRIGISFGYWYLRKKLMMKRLWQKNFLQHLIYDAVLKALGEPFATAEGRVADARRFFVTGNGRFGWAPHRTKVDDKVCVFRGMRTPVIMRPQGIRWEFIGVCYVQGLMDGEIWDLEGLKWDFMSFL
ncbi:heterokaryon incompatibility protein-domain-containing protein [Xylariales sp. PMI_506]|nr:heterokaryon incompatibility protein-domain-containing protein [Xylariales sp. PMI_506]